MRLRAESLMRRTLAATSRPPRPPRTLSPSARNNVDTSRDHTRGDEATRIEPVLLRARRRGWVARSGGRPDPGRGAGIERAQHRGGRLPQDAPPADAPA